MAGASGPRRSMAPGTQARSVVLLIISHSPLPSCYGQPLGLHSRSASGSEQREAGVALLELCLKSERCGGCSDARVIGFVFSAVFG